MLESFIGLYAVQDVIVRQVEAAIDFADWLFHRLLPACAFVSHGLSRSTTVTALRPFAGNLPTWGEFKIVKRP
jgi:hypothetical protein